MNKILGLLICIGIFSCKYTSTEENLQTFIKTHPHPIQCVGNNTGSACGILKSTVWTLTDAKVDMFVSEATDMSLPSVIK